MFKKRAVHIMSFVLRIVFIDCRRAICNGKIFIYLFFIIVHVHNVHVKKIKNEIKL